MTWQTFDLRNDIRWRTHSPSRHLLWETLIMRCISLIGIAFNVVSTWIVWVVSLPECHSDSECSLILKHYISSHWLAYQSLGHDSSANYIYSTRILLIITLRNYLWLDWDEAARNRINTLSPTSSDSKRWSHHILEASPRARQPSLSFHSEKYFWDWRCFEFCWFWIFRSSLHRSVLHLFDFRNYFVSEIIF